MPRIALLSCRSAAILAGVAAQLVWSSQARAQSTGVLNARVRVVRALRVAGTGNLRFGNIAPTSSKTVAPAAGGRFRIRGAPGQAVSLTFTLPANLGNPAVAIGAWTGLVHTRNTPGAATAFVPSAAPQTRTLHAVSGRLFVWIGATVTTTGAPVGNYSAPVRLTVVYN